MRLAARQIRPVLADHFHRLGQDAGRQGCEEGHRGHEGDAADEEARHQRPAAGVRPRLEVTLEITSWERSMHARVGWQSCWWRAGLWSGAALVLFVAACSPGRDGRAAQAAAGAPPPAPTHRKPGPTPPCPGGTLQPHGAYKARLPPTDPHVTTRRPA